MLDADALINAIGPQLLEGLRKDIQPLLAEAQAEIRAALDAQSSELSANVFNRVAQTRRIVYTIKSWMEKTNREAQAAQQNGTPLQVQGPNFNGEGSRPRTGMAV